MNKARLLVLMLVILISGCKTELYSELSEREGNEMLAILLAEGIDAEKSTSKEGVALKVDHSQVVHALEALKRQGFPKDSFSTVQDLFPDEGLISSPTQERARFIYSKSQEISSTLSQIDGVITARVHIALPEAQKSSSKQPQAPATASVFIKHSPDIQLEAYSAQIKTLVNNSIEGLQYDKISVVLFPATDVISTAQTPHFVNVLTVKVEQGSRFRFWMILALLCSLLIGSNLAWWVYHQKKSQNS